MPVCLTGDVHHQSLGTRDQAALNRTEPAVAVEYAEIVASYGLDATLFVTGRTADESPNAVEAFGALDRIEVGGHNYAAFTIPDVPRSDLLFKTYRKYTGNNCPKFWQHWGVRKTRRRLEAITGEAVVSWRDHAFNRDSNTNDVLAASGVKYVSDERTPDKMMPYPLSVDSGSLVEVPVNVPPDHDHVHHADKLVPEGWSDPFSGDVYNGEEWLDRVLDVVDRIDSRGGVATILAHPGCMALVEDFGIFERLCGELSAYETVAMRDIENTVDVVMSPTA